jgi:hypothetical protein
VHRKAAAAAAPTPAAATGGRAAANNTAAGATGSRAGGFVHMGILSSPWWKLAAVHVMADVLWWSRF